MNWDSVLMEAMPIGFVLPSFQNSEQYALMKAGEMSCSIPGEMKLFSGGICSTVPIQYNPIIT